MDKVLNFKISPKDSRDYITKPPKINESITTVDLSSNCTSVKDQGSVGSCTAFSSVAMMEYVYKKNGISIPDDLLSELFLYYNTRVLIENTSAYSDSGAFLRDTLKAMVKYGICLEKTFPYSSNYSLKPNQTSYNEGLNYQVVKYANIPTSNPRTALNDLKALLQSGNVFIGGVYCYQNFFDGVNGNIPLPKGRIIGGHAICFVGYDDKKSVFKFKNSWGKGWGDKGYGYLPYQYLISGNMTDLWTVYGEEYNNKLIGSSGSVIPPSLRISAITGRMNTIMTTISQLDDNTGLPCALTQKVIDKLKEDMSNDENNFLLLPKDIREISSLIDRLVSNVKLTHKNLLT